MNPKNFSLLFRLREDFSFFFHYTASPIIRTSPKITDDISINCVIKKHNLDGTKCEPGWSATSHPFTNYQLGIDAAIN